MKKAKYIAPKIEVIKTITESMLNSATAATASCGVGSDDVDYDNMGTWINNDIKVDNGQSDIDPD